MGQGRWQGYRGGLCLPGSVGLGRGFPSSTPALREAGPLAGWGRNGSDLAKAHRLSPQVPLNIGALFQATTEGGSVALGLRNKNQFSKALLLVQFQEFNQNPGWLREEDMG